MVGFNNFNQMGQMTPLPSYSNYTMSNPMANMQSIQSQISSLPQANSGILGRMVNNENEITPNEVPMDGGMSLFPKSDYSCIFAKGWNSNGTIRTVKFVPELENGEPSVIEAKVTNSVGQDVLDDLESRFNERFDKLESLIKRNTNHHKSYKKPYNKNNQNGSGTDNKE